MKVKIMSANGTSANEIDLNDSLFASKINDHLIYEVIKNQLANKRQGTTSVKTVSTVNGSTRKPWKQKGTGRARVGSAKSPLWKGGGVIFGPQKRDYSYRISKKKRRTALFSILSLLLKEDRLRVLEDVVFEEFSTKKMNAIFSKVCKTKKVICVISSFTLEDKPSCSFIRKSLNNISWIKTVNVEALEFKDLYYAHEVVFFKSAIEHLNNFYSSFLNEVNVNNKESE